MGQKIFIEKSNKEKSETKRIILAINMRPARKQAEIVNFSVFSSNAHEYARYIYFRKGGVFEKMCATVARGASLK